MALFAGVSAAGGVSEMSTDFDWASKKIARPRKNFRV
jgi:hypothetical protein